MPLKRSSPPRPCVGVCATPRSSGAWRALSGSAAAAEAARRWDRSPARGVRAKRSTRPSKIATSGGGDPMIPSTTAEPERIRILLVDDRSEDLVALRAILDRPDYELVLATSGEQALIHLLRGPVALIVMDVSMPRLN